MFSDFLKRAFDVCLSIFGLIFFSPLFLIFALLIKHESPGSPFFSQQRVGRKGKPFTLYKFRSMVNDAEKDGVPALCCDKDERLTKVGAFLRRHHLDELPQLWNVLVGDMSFVGYRPEREYFIKKIMEVRPDYERLYEMRPGVFSKATLYNGYTDTMEKMIRRLDMDLEYLENRSLWCDIKIIFLTFMSIVTGKEF